MNDIDKGFMANELITYNLISYLIKKGVIDEADYIEHTEIIKHASMQRIEQIDGIDEGLSKEIIKNIFDEHLSSIRDNDL